MTHVPRLAPLLVAVLALGGCGAGEAPDEAGQSVSASTTTTTARKTLPTKAYTVQQLGAALECEPQLVGKTKDFRQANCAAADSRYVLLDFDTAAGQRAWLDTAFMYGGVYLVGERWVLAAETEGRLETLQETLGGTIEDG